MSASADYAAAAAMLRKPLPAYVTFTQHTHANVFGPFMREDTETITIRTRDGKIIKGKESMTFSGGSHGNPISEPLFVPSCYRATGAKPVTYEGVQVEAISLKLTCGSKDENGFDTMYVDTKSRTPLGVKGRVSQSDAAVQLEQRFARVGAYVLPSQIIVGVSGTGFLFWLNVAGDAQFSDYRFSSTPPK